MSFRRIHNLDSPVKTKDKEKFDDLGISTESPGSLVQPTQSLSDHENPENQLLTLVERASSLVSAVTNATENRLGLVEQEMSSLLSGKTTVDQLAAKYGELSVSESDSLKQQLSRVMNALAVEQEKIAVERQGIKVQESRALLALDGLRSAFNIKAATEKTRDAHDEAAYQGQVRDQKNVARTQDIQYRSDRNALELESQQDQLAHKASMNDIASQFREAVRRGAEAGLKLRKFQTERKVTATERIIGKIKNPRSSK